MGVPFGTGRLNALVHLQLHTIATCSYKYTIVRALGTLDWEVSGIETAQKVPFSPEKWSKTGSKVAFLPDRSATEASIHTLTPTLPHAVKHDRS